MSTLTFTTGTLNVTCKVSVTVSAGDLSTVEDVIDYDAGDTLKNGTAIDQQDQVWQDRRTVTAAAEDLDLTSLTDSFGNTLSFQKLKGIMVKNRSTTAGEDLIVGGDANSVPIFSDTSDKIIVGPDGVLLLTDPSLAGHAVTGGTGDIVQIDPGAATITYDIIIWGIKT